VTRIRTWRLGNWGRLPAGTDVSFFTTEQLSAWGPTQHPKI